MGGLQSCGLSTTQVWFFRLPLQFFSRYYRVFDTIVDALICSHIAPLEKDCQRCVGISESYRATSSSTFVVRTMQKPLHQIKDLRGTFSIQIRIPREP